MLRLPDHWLWDFWIADDGTAYHLFFLKAPRVGDPGQLHWNVRIGHAVSPDLSVWEVLADAIGPSSEAAFDDYANLDRVGREGRRRTVEHVLHRHQPRGTRTGAAHRRRHLPGPAQLDQTGPATRCHQRRPVVPAVRSHRQTGGVA